MINYDEIIQNKLSLFGHSKDTNDTKPIGNKYENIIAEKLKDFGIPPILDTGNATKGDIESPILTKAKEIMNNTKENYSGYCQKFVDDVLDVPYPRIGHESAIDAWNNAKNKIADPTLKGAKPGDLISFSPNYSNVADGFPEGAGHTGFYEGNNKFISAAANGIVDEYNIDDWNKLNGTQTLGYIPQ